MHISIFPHTVERLQLVTTATRWVIAGLYLLMIPLATRWFWPQDKQATRLQKVGALGLGIAWLPVLVVAFWGPVRGMMRIKQH